MNGESDWPHMGAVDASFPLCAIHGSLKLKGANADLEDVDEEGEEKW